MRHSSTSSTRVLTIVTLAVLSSLSFSFVHAQNVLDTPHNRDVLHRRAIHHLRAPVSPSVTPTSTPSPTSSQSPSVDTSSKTPTSTSVPPSTSSTPTSSLTPSSTDTSSSPAQSTSSSQPSDTTSPTPTSTSSQTSSTPTSTSSPGNTSSSPPSSSSPTTSTTPVQANVPNGVSTTPLASNSPVTNSGYSFTPDPGSTVFANPTAGAVSKGFFAHKAAVAATFSIIGIICGLAAIIGAVTMFKRYRRSRNDDDEFYEKYPGAPAAGSTNHSRFSRDLGHGPLGASATDLSIDAAPPEAYPDRAIHYGQPNQPTTVFRPVDYGIDYPPPNAAAAADANPRNSTDIAYEQYDYDPNRRSTSAGSHPFADPANAPRTAAAPPVTYPRTVQGRAQEMVTVDSYYGPNTAGVGASGAGYAQ